MDALIADLSIWIIPVLLAITLHEAAHGYVARHFGDPTAELAGRITLNPLKHIDPVGTVAVPLALYFFSASVAGTGFLFGWAKPVPVNFTRLRSPKTDMIWVAAAGPFVNLLMAVAWAAFFKIATLLPETVYRLPMLKMAEAGILINAILMFFNLLPVPPLDGGRIAVGLLPYEWAVRYARIEPFGIPIVLALFFFGGMNRVFGMGIAYFHFGLSMLFGGLSP